MNSVGKVTIFVWLILIVLPPAVAYAMYPPTYASGPLSKGFHFTPDVATRKWNRAYHKDGWVWAVGHGSGPADVQNSQELTEDTKVRVDVKAWCHNPVRSGTFAHCDTTN